MPSVHALDAVQFIKSAPVDQDCLFIGSSYRSGKALRQVTRQTSVLIASSSPRLVLPIAALANHSITSFAFSFFSANTPQ
jgi:hypothetical protein